MKKLKPAELFLSLGLIATLATACGPTEETDVEVEEGETIEEPVGEDSMEAPVGEPLEEEGMEEGGEGGEGGEG